jgi:GrpB-like predicted nucleotidyltransferase (UPF0157 family)
MLGCERHLVRLVPYQPAWTELFYQESELLRTELGGQVVRIEHVGSTSLSGLHPKRFSIVWLQSTASPMALLLREQGRASASLGTEIENERSASPASGM